MKKLKYRIDARILLDTYEDAKRLYDLIGTFKPLMRTIKEGRIGEERSYVILHRCPHDESPPEPCEIIEKIESE